MSAENDEKPVDGEGAERKSFSAADARQRAEEAARVARQKSEFILSRAYGLVREPKKEWDQIRAEETNIPSVIFGYVMPLVGFFAVCNFIGSMVFDRPDLIKALVSAIVTVLVLTGFIFVIGLIINTIAENFDSDRDDLAAQKIAAYSFTPFFLSGIFLLWPPLFWVLAVSVGMSAFLIYRGLPPLMKTPADRATGYAATVCIAGLVGFIVAFLIAGCVTGAGSL